MWMIAVLMSGLIIAARHHYSVDVVIAWYVVPLVWSTYARLHDDPPIPMLPDDFPDPERERLLISIET
jgi:hypothetical protein